VFSELKRTKGLSFEEAMKIEYRIVSRMFGRHDIVEGIRSTLLERDRKPRWDPPSLEQVSTELLEEIFAPLGPERPELFENE